jgi:hypothetical protein
LQAKGNRHSEDVFDISYALVKSHEDFSRTQSTTELNKQKKTSPATSVRSLLPFANSFFSFGY